MRAQELLAGLVASLVASLVVGWAACDTELPPIDGGLVDAAPVAQGSPARGDLVINEVSPRSPDGPDWIELLNRSSQPVDLCGFFVTDDLDRLDHYVSLGGVLPPSPCPPVLLDAGAYLVIVADDDVAAGPDHAPFKLGEDDSVYVVDMGGLATDSFLYLYPRGHDNLTLARIPDGEGLFFLVEPTRGQANPPTPEDLP